MSKDRDQQIGIRVTSAERAELGARAEGAGLSLTAYIVRAGLGTLDDEPVTTGGRLDTLEDRLETVERDLARLQAAAGMD